MRRDGSFTRPSELTCTREKLVAYIEETRRYILPMLREAKQRFPEESEIFFVLKDPIVSVVDAVEETMRVYGAGEATGASGK